MAKFKARARALDMLGRQQIAGIPNALHELFKNAHDAYADNVEVDFFRESNLLLLRDDGVGMTREDFEGKWLTLGTESKVDPKKSRKELKPSGKKPRPVMGEKGIGRLAIATIGPQVLIITRAVRGDNLSSITVSLVNWSMYELPGIDLDEIEIPIFECSTVKEVTSNALAGLVDSIRENLGLLAKKSSSDIINRISDELDKFNPEVVIKALLLSYGPSLEDGKTGAHFIIIPVAAELRSDIDDDLTTSKSAEATNLERHLLGFSNTMQSDLEALVKTKFRDHNAGEVNRLVGPEEFFTPDEYDIADHHIKGEFDDYGNFSGTVQVYHQEPQKLELILNRSGEKLDCGKFSIDFAYLQGNSKDSTLPFDQHRSLFNKLNKIGGLYVYMDGIRVLPYGNSDYDFLEIERRRSIHAGFYYFSYRRMFGAINISRVENAKLQEKAGREGFQGNKAYRQFRGYLMQFFEELAAKYFREDGVYASDWSETKKSLNKEYKAQQRRKGTVTTKRKELGEKLDIYFAEVEEGQLLLELEEICSSAEKQIHQLSESSELEDVASQIIEIEAKATNELKQVYDRSSIKKPRGVGLSKSLTRKWVSYEQNFNQSLQPKYDEARQRLDEGIGELSKKAKNHLDMRVRLQASLDSLREYSFKKVSDQRSNTQKALSEAEKYVKEQLKSARIELESVKTKVEREILNTDFSQLDPDEFTKLRSSLEVIVEGSSDALDEKLETIKNQLLSIDSNSDQAALSDERAVASLETELEVLRADYDSSLEMAQLGMAVSVIHHEFEANIRGVRKTIKELSQWAKQNDVLNDLYVEMRDGFDHLDNYLSLFTPLDRRMRRRKTKITGDAIHSFVKDLFGDRFARHDVKLKVESDFHSMSLDGFVSVVFPVFVNVIDNAIYWLSRKDGDRTIVLGATKAGFSIADSGPGISVKDIPHIFDFGFTRKVSGRGMGLYISKTSLNKEDLDIVVDDDYKSGTKFIIQKR